MLRALIVLVGLGGAWANNTPQISEHAAKAAMLLKFLGYVKFPERSFESPTSPLKIAVVGADPFGRGLDEAFKDKRFGARKIEIVRFKSVAELDRCHLLFVPEAEAARLDRILEFYGARPPLIVGESKDFAAAGASINFTINDKKIGFEINTDAAKRAELELSSQLLKLAKIVKDAKRDGNGNSEPGDDDADEEQP
jgi:hypothetical protein